MQALRRSLIAAAVATLAACGSSSSPVDGRAATMATWTDGRLAIDVPVPVVTFGFPDADVRKLQEALQPLVIDHVTGDLSQFPPDLDDASQADPFAVAPTFGETLVLPIKPTARYAVSAAPAALQAKLQAALATAKREDGFYDAVKIEDFLAASLPLDPDAPTIVLLHLKALGVKGAHSWRLQGQTGFLSGVRMFGERHPLLVLDPSADADIRAAGTTTDPLAENVYHNPVATSATEEIAEFVRDATHYRVLQGSIYPVAQASCHAVTALIGVRDQTSLSEMQLRKVRDNFDAARVKAGWDHLTDVPVYFDYEFLSLPADDPALDALARGEFPAFEAMRTYLGLMFEQYHVEHAGCEEYLTVVFAGDVATVPGGGVLGIGTYDDTPGQRIAMGWVHEAFRYAFDPESPLCISGCTDKDYLNFYEYIVSHETGHILGQRHPHDISRGDGDEVETLAGESNNGFSSVWSSMSYHQEGRVIDFGAIDRNNWLRNRAAFALSIAARDGREGSPAWNAAISRAQQYDWSGAWAALQPGS